MAVLTDQFPAETDRPRQILGKDESDDVRLGAREGGPEIGANSVGSDDLGRGRVQGHLLGEGDRPLRGRDPEDVTVGRGARVVRVVGACDVGPDSEEDDDQGQGEAADDDGRRGGLVRSIDGGTVSDRVRARRSGRFASVGAQASGIARGAYEIALDDAKNRVAFGKPIIMNQAIAFKLANMITQIDAARLLIWRASWLAKNGGYKNAEGSQSKYYASEMSVRVTEDAIQILGGYGYTREYPVERWHRDAKIHTIFEGTSEIQQLVIARAISGLRVE